jgi:hypothetical protein
MTGSRSWSLWLLFELEWEAILIIVSVSLASTCFHCNEDVNTCVCTGGATVSSLCDITCFPVLHLVGGVESGQTEPCPVYPTNPHTHAHICLYFLFSSALHCVHVSAIHVFRTRHYGARAQTAVQGIGALHLLACFYMLCKYDTQLPITGDHLQQHEASCTY